MKKYGFNFWAIFLPFHIIGFVGLFYLFENWLTFILLWFVIGVIGNGVAGHRYFAHGQFKTYRPIKYLLGILTSLGGIGPASYWAIQHKAHHLFAETELDPHSPKHNSAWYVFYAWTFPQGNNQEQYLKHRWAKVLAVKQMRNKDINFFHLHHYKIIYIFCAVLAIINIQFLLMYCLAYCLDFLRLGSINYFCHQYGYKNHPGNDLSTNNLWLGWLGMGFGWHNNHHKNPGKLILTERWWEIDIEGYIGWILSKRS